MIARVMVDRLIGKGLSCEGNPSKIIGRPAPPQALTSVHKLHVGYAVEHGCVGTCSLTEEW